MDLLLTQTSLCIGSIASMTAHYSSLSEHSYYLRLFRLFKVILGYYLRHWTVLTADESYKLRYTFLFNTFSCSKRSEIVHRMIQL